MSRLVPPMPMRLAEQIEPRATLDRIPPTQALGPDGVPYSGEVREEESARLRFALQPGGQASIVGLKRAWRVVGWMLDPANLSGGTGLTVQLRIIVRGGARALSLQTWTVPAGPPLFVFGLEVGARVELVVTNPSVVAVTNIQGALWGMNER